MKTIKRKLSENIKKSLNDFPVVSILGSRQVGKTTLAKEIKKEYNDASVYIDLELNSDFNKLAQNSELYLKQHEDKLVIIDEIQIIPELFPLIRALVDQKRTAGRFLILGSASPSLLKHSSQSLAGRIVYHELTPFLITETDSNFDNLWIRGGYPESFLAKNDKTSFIWRDAFIKTYLERDIPQLGINISYIKLRKFLTMIAHLHGQIWNASKIAGSLGISAPTANKYLDILQYTFLIKIIEPYYLNIKKRLIKSPKVYIRDTGLLHNLLGISSLESLYGHPSIGNSWEGFVLEQIIAMIPQTWKYFFYRTRAGAEIDLVIIDENNKKVAVEIKYSISPKTYKGFWNALDDLSCDKAFIVYPGDEMYPISDKVYALPISNIKKLIE
jgi:uncharacterized protein